MITYRKILGIKTEAYHVLLEGKIVGKIKQTTEGWRYWPDGSNRPGDVFHTLKECKRSLEDVEGV